MKKAIIALTVLCVFIVTPRSLAEDLLSPILGTVDAPGETGAPAPTDSPAPTESPTPDPSPSTTAAPLPAPTASSSTPPEVPTIATSDSPTASASPTPVPPHAIADQSMNIAVPATVSTDPRAHSVFLPRLNVNSVNTLLICGYSNASAVSFTSGFPGIESAGSGSPFFRISGPAHLVMAALNSEMGARVTSSSKAIPGSIVSFSFVALSKPSISTNLCNEGSPSNNRTISFRALNMDLNMVKDPVRLK
ncbi:hypothetical protein MCEMRE22_01031 [Candidatus Nanopelagicaceae bacterium]